MKSKKSVYSSPVGDLDIYRAVKQHDRVEFLYSLERQERDVLQDLIDAMTEEQYEEYVRRTENNGIRMFP